MAELLVVPALLAYGEAAFAYALYRVELLGKRLDANLRELREALS